MCSVGLRVCVVCEARVVSLGPRLLAMIMIMFEMRHKVGYLNN